MSEAIAKSERTRAFIIEQAAALFNKHGYAGTSMDDILKATGLSKGGVYGNFRSKEDIALAAFEHAVEVVTKEVRQLTHGIAHPLDKLRAVVLFYQERIFTPPIEGGCPILNTSVEADDNHPALRQKVLDALDQWQQRIIYVLEKGMESGLVRKDTNTSSFAIRFIGMLEGAILLARLYQNESHFEIIANALLDMIEDLRITQSPKV